MKKNLKSLIPGLKKSSKKSKKSNELILSLRAQQAEEWTNGAEFKDPSPELGVQQMIDITIILNN